jgi:hypothetical protein
MLPSRRSRHAVRIADGDPPRDRPTPPRRPGTRPCRLRPGLVLPLGPADLANLPAARPRRFAPALPELRPSARRRRGRGRRLRPEESPSQLGRPSRPHRAGPRAGPGRGGPPRGPDPPGCLPGRQRLSAQASQEAAGRAPATRHAAPRGLAGRRRREGHAPERPPGQLADGRGRGHRRPARRRAFPPRNGGRRSPPGRPATCSAVSSAAGACPNGSDSTTAIPGARPATCPPNWRCGW